MSAWSSRPICWIWAALSIARPDVAAPQSPSLTDSTRERLGALVGSETPALQAFYARQGLRPVWSGDAGALPRAFELQRLLSQADQDGLSPDDYALPPLRPALDPDSLAAFDVALSRAALHYAADLASGRVDPAAVESVWTAAPREINLADVLETELASEHVPAIRTALSPPQTGYTRLRGALAHYREIAARGGWTPLPDGTIIAPGDSGPAVTALRARLVAEGDLVGPSDTAARYDVALSAAVRRFQRRHGLAPDGAVGPATLAELNVPVEQRIRQMELNLERWRWLPRALGERYVMVNSAALDVAVVQHDSVVLRMRAVVGRLDWPTPIVSSQITGLQFAPAWNIPRSIAVQEILPLVRRDTTYLRRHRIRVLSDSTRGVEIDPATVDWSRVTDSTFAFQLRQEPGGTNPLGGVKFFFPNRFSSFIHDTPFRTAFREPVRTASHGCVRVEGAVDLAVYLLDNPARWPRDSIRRAMKRPEGRWVALRRPIPVHLGYWTAWVAQDGTVEFRDDFYGWDSALERALAAR